MMLSRIPLLATTALGLFASFAHAQWPNDPAVDLSVGDGASDQSQPKVVPTPDGGVWISWFDGIGSGWDVRVQKLDAAGNEVLPHNGVLVADRSFSSTQDYGLDTDASGNALLTFRDDRFTGTQISAAKVTPAGTLSWGANGIQLTSTTSFVASPRIAGTSDGGAVVAWTQDFETRLQKLDANGVPQWMSDVVQMPATGSYSVADLHDSGTDVIVSMVFATGGFGSPRHLVAQKFDSTGAPLWTVNPVPVLDSGSLQFGNFPSFVPDGSGGAVFSWYTSSALQCFAQRVDASGTELFPHNGVAVSNAAGQVRVDPSASYDASTGDTYVFWTEQNTGQSMFGLSGQRLDSSGALLWGSTGASLIPVGSDEIRQVRVLMDSAGGALVFWDQSPAFGQDQLFGAHVDASGAIDVPIFPVASTVSGKSRLDVTETTSQRAVLAWGDSRVDGGDILAKDVGFDGSLGAPDSPGIDHCNGDGGDQMGCTPCPCGNESMPGTIGGCLNSSGGSTRLSAFGDPSVSLPSGSSTDLRFEVQGSPPSSTNVLLSGNAVAPQGMANPCFGLNSGIQSADRDGLRCVVQAIQRHGNRSADGLGNIQDSSGPSRVWGGPAQPTAGIAGQAGFVAGQTRFFQITHRDVDGAVCPPGTGLNTSQAREITFTP